MGAAYGLAGRDAPMLSKLAEQLGKVNGGRALNLRIAGRTVAEWAEYARANGIISRIAHAGDPVVADEPVRMGQRRNSPRFECTCSRTC